MPAKNTAIEIVSDMLALSRRVGELCDESLRVTDAERLRNAETAVSLLLAQATKVEEADPTLARLLGDWADAVHNVITRVVSPEEEEWRAQIMAALSDHLERLGGVLHH